MAAHQNAHFVTRPVCPCCGAGGGAVLMDTPFCEPPVREYLESFYGPQGGVEFDWLGGANFTLIECADCGLIYQKHIGDDATMARLYDRWIDPLKAFAMYDGVLPPAHFIELGRQIGNVLEFLGRNPREVSCLDFGMGWGHWCRVARGFGCQVWGTELSEARIASAKEQGLRVLPSAEIPKMQFDLINTEQVFEHLPEPFETLAFLVQGLKRGGLIRISVPDGWDIKRRLRVGDWNAAKGSRNSLNPVAPLEHINCFNHDAICRLGARAGLVERDIPERFATSLVDGVKGLIRPLAYRLTGRGVALYFEKTTA